MGKGILFAFICACVAIGSKSSDEVASVTNSFSLSPHWKGVVEIYELGHEHPLVPNNPEQRIYRSNKEFSREEKECLAKNIYFEAKNQSIRGQLAVALVTLNRVKSPYYANTICEVVYQRNQFSWYWDGKPDTPVNKHAFFVANQVADAVLSTDSAFVDFTDGADHYHAEYVEPSWHKTMTRVVQVEAHIFYRAYELKQSL